MPPIVSTVDIARPPDEVFSYVTDPSRFTEWQDDVVSVRMEEGRPPGMGSRFTTTRRIGGVERTMTQEITETTPPRSWAAQGVDGPIRPAANITIEPLDDGARSRSRSTSKGTGSAGSALRPTMAYNISVCIRTSDTGTGWATHHRSEQWK
jgi:uncharacterized protein YndB with AHSA1/START domain